MIFDITTLLLLIVGALLLSLIAVIVDRINFPQRPFKAKKIEVNDEFDTRDRTGAHIVDIEPNLGGHATPGADPGPNPTEG